MNLKDFIQYLFEEVERKLSELDDMCGSERDQDSYESVIQDVQRHVAKLKELTSGADNQIIDGGKF